MKHLLSYDPETGALTWAAKHGKKKPGDPAGWVDNGYVRISINGKSYLAHRVAWFLHYGEWPKTMVDHINRNPLDNRITNLRLATRIENSRNSRPKRDPTVGLAGASFHRTQKQWRARITVNKRLLMLGWFDTERDAHEAYLAAAKHHFGKFFPSESK